MALASKNNSDVFYTPRSLVIKILDYFEPSGKLLEPYSGDGAFLDFMGNADWCEIDKGRDYFQYNNQVDWEVTNPPFSLIRQGLTHSTNLGHKNILWVVPISNILGLKARMNIIKNAGYGIKEIVCIERPHTFPQSGFQIAVIHIKKSYIGDTKLSWKDWT